MAAEPEFLGAPYTPKVQLFPGSGYSTPRAQQQNQLPLQAPRSNSTLTNTTPVDGRRNSITSPVSSSGGAPTPLRGVPHTRPMSPMRIINKLGFFTTSSSIVTGGASNSVAGEGCAKNVGILEGQLRAVTQDYMIMVGERDAARRELMCNQREKLCMEETIARQQYTEEQLEAALTLQREFTLSMTSLMHHELERTLASKHDLALENTELRRKVVDLENTLEDLQKNRQELMELTQDISEQEPHLHALEMQQHEQLQNDYQRLTGERNALRAEVGRQFIAMRMEQGERMKVVRELTTLRATVQVETKQWQMEREQLINARNKALKAAEEAAASAQKLNYQRNHHRIESESTLGGPSSINSLLIGPMGCSGNGCIVTDGGVANVVVPQNRRRNRKTIGQKPIGSNKAPSPLLVPSQQHVQLSALSISILNKGFLPPLVSAQGAAHPTNNVGPPTSMSTNPQAPNGTATSATNTIANKANDSKDRPWRLALSDLNANLTATFRGV